MIRTFDPWVGSNYWTEGLAGVRVMILGESHYGDPGTEVREYTVNVVKAWGQKKRARFFTATQKLVCGLSSDAWVSDPERARFWELVAFYNFVQSFPGRRPRCRPTAEMWGAALEPFFATVHELRPHAVVALGFELHDHLPLTKLLSGTRVVRCQHPSSPGFRYEPWTSAVRAVLQAVRQGDHSSQSPKLTGN